MTDENKTPAQLVNELAEMRQRVAELEASETRRGQVEQALKESLEQIERAKQEWEVTADSLPQLVCLLDHEGHVIRTNRTIERWGLADVTNVKGKKVYELLHPGHPASTDDVEALLQQAWQGLTQGQSAEWEVEDKILKRHLHIQVQPISTQTGRQSRAAGSFAALIIHDITQRKQAERLKNEFLANISLELQTPLTSIIGYSQMLLVGIEGELPPEIFEDIQGIHESGQQLLTLVNEILDLAEIETGSLVLTAEEVLIESLLDQVKTNHTTLLQQKPVEINVEVEPNLPSITADKMRLNQILNHLVANAIKFTEQGGVNVRAFRENGWICLEVADNGIGISEADLETIFEKFRQVDGSLSRRAEGAGLGLTITRHLVQLHGGTIGVHSRVGQGTTVTVRLPIVR
jgi:PAS domain S-box-containing protein